MSAHNAHTAAHYIWTQIQKQSRMSNRLQTLKSNLALDVLAYILCNQLYCNLQWVFENFGVIYTFER